MKYTDMNCKGCAHWRDGSCHFDPPTVIWAGNSIITAWPKTEPNEGCGKFEPREAVPFTRPEKEHRQGLKAK